jgi:hypothetical protein
MANIRATSDDHATGKVGSFMNKFVGISLVLFVLSLTLTVGCGDKGKKGTGTGTGTGTPDETEGTATPKATGTAPKGTEGTKKPVVPPVKKESIKLEDLKDAKVKQGATVKIDVTIARENLKGEVTLKVEGLDEDSFKVTAPKIAADKDAGTIEIMAAADAKEGAVTATVTAEAGGQSDSKKLKLTVEKK